MTVKAEEMPVTVDAASSEKMSKDQVTDPVVDAEAAGAESEEQQQMQELVVTINIPESDPSTVKIPVSSQDW